MNNISMVDLAGQYLAIKNEIDEAIHSVLAESAFIKGRFVRSFEQNLANYLGVRHVIGVGNGTDALQISMMALGIGPGDEVIAPSFTFVATAEAVALLRATPVFADIDPHTFNISIESIESLITPATRAIIPVHLYGQPANMDAIMALARKYDLRVIEDCAQAIGARYGRQAAGTIGDLGTFSFFPSKNLGCYGDGGAIVTNDDGLADSCRLIANHGSRHKYHNEVIGINSRLDGLQAAILDVKLKYLDEYSRKRTEVANAYDHLLRECPSITVPHRADGRTHVFHQYTIRMENDTSESGQELRRDSVSGALKQDGIPHAIYYPIPVHRLPVYQNGIAACRYSEMPYTDTVVDEVISLPMHTELTSVQIHRITSSVLESVTAYAKQFEI